MRAGMWLVLAALALVSTGCGGGGSSGPFKSGTTTVTNSPPPGTPGSNSSLEVTVAPVEQTVVAGERIEVTATITVPGSSGHYIDVGVECPPEFICPSSRDQWLSGTTKLNIVVDVTKQASPGSYTVTVGGRAVQNAPSPFSGDSATLVITVEASAQVGFEILEITSQNSVRAWISPEITFEEFNVLEVPSGWIKNQPRESEECGADNVRFIKSPDSTENGDILQQELFGFNWFHAATVTQSNITLDDEGLLRGSTVRKFHELTFNAGSCLVLLISPEGDVYFRIGRDANRVSDEPSIPNLWRLEEYTTPEQLVIDLFEENLVIRTNNEDSFQGPVPELEASF